ncbi:MAG: cyclic nucleotide-binding domain-containing protein [Acidobacteria bacterium]|nr:cyclic nucleotide-binding domain-containing protein [Acidobacteriota bacterium]
MKDKELSEGLPPAAPPAPSPPAPPGPAAKTVFAVRTHGALQVPVIRLGNPDVLVIPGAIHYSRDAVETETLQWPPKKTQDATDLPIRLPLTRCRGTGELHLDPSFGEYHVMSLDDEAWILPRKYFVACEITLNVVKLMEEGAGTGPPGDTEPLLRVAGTGTLLVISPGPVERIPLDGAHPLVASPSALLARESGVRCSGVPQPAGAGETGDTASAPTPRVLRGPGNVLLCPVPNPRSTLCPHAEFIPPPNPEVFQALRRVAIFQELPDEVLEGLARRSVLESRPARETVFNAGDEAADLYVVESGAVEVLRPAAPPVPPVCISVLGPGECFGEMALLSGEPRSATVRTTEAATLVRITRGDFLHLVSEASVYRRIVKMLCDRLRSSTTRIEEARRAHLSLSRRLQGYREFEKDRAAGSTSAARELEQVIAAAAACDGPVFVEGEEGSGKSLACALAIRKSRRAEGPVIVVDCPRGGVTAATEIFGQEEGPEGSAQWGALELCAEGSVVIEEPQALGPVAREQLLQALRTGKFRRIGGSSEVPLSARVFVTRRLKPDEVSHTAAPGLKNLFTGGVISIPPLRNRRKDIPEIVGTLGTKHAEAAGVPNPQISPAAMERLVSYDWPGNVGELDTVIRRAFTLAPEGRIDAEHILIHLPPGIKQGKVDLFRLPWLKAFLKSSFYPLILQIPALFVLGLIAVYCFVGPQSEDNFALTLTWPIWWAALPLSFLFLGRIWCSICPFALVSSGIQKAGGLKLPIPKFFRRLEIWPMTFLFLFLTWADEYWHYPDYPWMTGVVLVSVFGGTVLMSLIFERRTWCRYFCPLGGVNGVYSSASFLELRTNIDVCSNECTDHRCIAGDNRRPCPMLERPLAMDTNQNCNLCMNCLKVCPHGAVHLYLRKPGAEMWEMRKPLLSAGVLAVLLSGAMLLHAFCKYLGAWGLGLKDAPPAIWFGLATDEAAWTLGYILMLVAVMGIVMTAAAVSTGMENGVFSSNLAHYGLTFAVMAVLQHITLEGAEFFAEGIPDGVALVAGWLGGNADPEAYVLFTPLLVRLVQVFLGVCALVLTLYAIDRVSKQRGEEGRRSPGALPFHAAAALLGAMFVVFIVTAPLSPPGEAPAEKPPAAVQPAPPGAPAAPAPAAPRPRPATLRWTNPGDPGPDAPSGGTRAAGARGRHAARVGHPTSVKKGFGYHL